MNADELEAGRETDKLVAESLGWTNVREEFVRASGDLAPGRNVRFGDPDAIHKREPVPWFSEDLDDAWELVKKVAEGKGGCPLFSLKLDRYVGKEWECLMGELAGDGTWTAEAKADTPELAICRCWLKSKEWK